MSIDSKPIPGRRTLHFHSLDEVLADAERLVASPGTRTLGNWPLGQLFTHLALAINGSRGSRAVVCAAGRQIAQGPRSWQRNAGRLPIA